jgi:two-component system, NtrC family, response regulator HydG
MGQTEVRERILVVDDDPNTLELIQRNLTSEGYTVFTAPGVPDAIRLLETTPVDLVITDLKMPGVSGMDLVRHVRENLRDTEAMMITGYPSVGGAVEAVKSGAEEYLSKPFTDEELSAAVRRALDKLNRRRTSRDVETTVDHYGLNGDSPVMIEVYKNIAKASGSSATALITGESGTGKELVARAIHYNGPRASAPFVPVNCGGIPEALLESELFGYVKGAFTGANETRAGFFQTAEGGTIFLDEISETSLTMQVKLLRVLQEKEVYMVGANKPQFVNVRILAATNKNLPSSVEKGQFREDLYFRLNVLTITLPPLRERGSDILILANYFLQKYSEKAGREGMTFSDSALNSLTRYDWPGNVRELQNIMQRLVVMVEGNTIDVTDLPTLMRYSAPRDAGLDRSLADVEAEHIKNVLTSVKGNKSHAAKILGIDRKTLREKLKSYCIPSDEPSKS